MNIFKIGLMLITGAGLGLGFDMVTEEPVENDQTVNEEYYSFMPCHQNEFMLEYMFEDLSDEDRLLVEEKVESLLFKYETTEENLYQDLDLYHDFMFELMEFLYENDIEFQHYQYDETDGFRHHRMGRR